MYQKILSWCEPIFKKLLTLFAGIAAVLTVLDYLLQWKIYPYFFSLLKSVFLSVVENLFEVVVIFLLVILFVFSYWLFKQLQESKNEALEKRISNIEETLEKKVKENKAYSDRQSKAVEERMDERIFDLERSVVDFEIEEHKSKNQIGAMAGLVKKLKMDKKRGFGVESTLFEIREYIKDRGMPHYYIDDLFKVVNDCSENLSVLRKEIVDLAQEKMYEVK